MFRVPQGVGMGSGPLLHALSLPPHDQSAMHRGTSPVDTIASSLVSPMDSSVSNLSSTSSYGGPFTPAETLQMMPLHVARKDISENVDVNIDVCENSFGS